MYDSCFCLWCWALKSTRQGVWKERWEWSSREKGRTGAVRWHRTLDNKGTLINFSLTLSIWFWWCELLTQNGAFLHEFKCAPDPGVTEAEEVAGGCVLGDLLLSTRWVSRPTTICVHLNSTWNYTHLLNIKIVCRNVFGGKFINHKQTILVMKWWHLE